MSEEKKRIRIFVVGAPRSGTTYLQQLLMTHFALASFPETHFFAMAHPKNRWKRLLTWPALNVQGVTRKLAAELGVPYSSRYDIGIFAKDYISPYLALLDDAAQARGETAWIEKTPRHLHTLDTIERIDDVRIVHLIRRGEDTVASLYEAANKYRDQWGNRGRFSLLKGLSLEETIKRWNGDVARSLAAVGRRNHTFVFYEELLEDEAGEIERLNRFLGVKKRSETAEFEAAAHQVVGRDEPWKRNNFRKSKTGERKFLTLFSPKEQAYVDERLDMTTYEALKKCVADLERGAG